MQQIKTVKSATEEFRSSIPEIVDYFEDRLTGLPADRTARFREFDDREVFTLECPDHDHDCVVEGCGTCYLGSGTFGTTVEIFDRKGQWTTVALWSNYDSGGRGF